MTTYWVLSVWWHYDMVMLSALPTLFYRDSPTTMGEQCRALLFSFLLAKNHIMVEQIVESHVFWDAVTLMWRHLHVICVTAQMWISTTFRKIRVTLSAEYSGTESFTMLDYVKSNIKVVPLNQIFRSNANAGFYTLEMQYLLLCDTKNEYILLHYFIMCYDTWHSSCGTVWISICTVTFTVVCVTHMWGYYLEFKHAINLCFLID